jgi:hypothetical protein
MDFVCLVVRNVNVIRSRHISEKKDLEKIVIRRKINNLSRIFTSGFFPRLNFLFAVIAVTLLDRAFCLINPLQQFPFRDVSMEMLKVM